MIDGGSHHGTTLPPASAACCPGSQLTCAAACSTQGHLHRPILAGSCRTHFVLRCALPTPLSDRLTVFLSGCFVDDCTPLKPKMVRYWTMLSVITLSEFAMGADTPAR